MQRIYKYENGNIIKSKKVKSIFIDISSLYKILMLREASVLVRRIYDRKVERSIA